MQLLLPSRLFVACHMQHVPKPKAHTHTGNNWVTTKVCTRQGRPQGEAGQSTMQGSNNERHKGCIRLVNYTHCRHLYVCVCVCVFVCVRPAQNLCASPSVRQLRRRHFDVSLVLVHATALSSAPQLVAAKSACHKAAKLEELRIKRKVCVQNSTAT